MSNKEAMHKVLNTRLENYEYRGDNSFQKSKLMAKSPQNVKKTGTEMDRIHEAILDMKREMNERFDNCNAQNEEVRKN